MLTDDNFAFHILNGGHDTDKVQPDSLILATDISKAVQGFYYGGRPGGAIQQTKWGYRIESNSYLG